MTEPSLLPPQTRPTLVRHAVLVVATLMALLLYLDRFAIGIAGEYIREDMRMTQNENSWFQSAFFWSYALCMVPAGWFADRFGARRVLTVYILAWSAFTGLLGLASAVWMIIALRLLFGMAQAGAYPTAGGLIRVWYPISGRGVASSIVALGGRAGGVLAPILTAWLIIEFSQGVDPGAFDRSSLVNDREFVLALQKKPDDKRAAVLDRLTASFPAELQSTLIRQADQLQSETPDLTVFSSDWFNELIQQVSAQIKRPELFHEVDVSRLKMSPEGRQLQERRLEGATLDAAESTRLNRFILEASFPGAVKRFRGIGWRPTMIIYGVVGLAVAIAFYVIARDLPESHPWCNAAERNVIDDEPTRLSKASEAPNPPFPMIPMLTNFGLWGNSLMQAFTNIGWLFVMVTFPRYLESVHNVSFAGQAIMTAIPTAAGILGMYMGGWWTDLATHSMGRKWGRRLPVLATRFTAGLGYAICVVLSLCFVPDSSQTWLPWAYVAALCLMSFSVDMGNPAVWGYAQDVGGKYTASVLGWANMWGNLGAAVAPLVYGKFLGDKPTTFHWTLVFAACMVAFILSGLCSLVMDSTKPLTVPGSSKGNES